MVSLLRPLDLELVFEDRAYELGETVNIAVDLAPRTNVSIREGRIDLVCEESYQQNYKAPVLKERRHIGKESAMRMIKWTMGPPRGTVNDPAYFFNEDVTKNRKKSYAHSSITFCSNARLRSGTTNSYGAKLAIRPEPPQHMLDGTATKGTVIWMLEATIDVAWSRDHQETWGQSYSPVEAGSTRRR